MDNNNNNLNLTIILIIILILPTIRFSNSHLQSLLNNNSLWKHLQRIIQIIILIQVVTIKCHSNNKKIIIVK